MEKDNIIPAEESIPPLVPGQKSSRHRILVVDDNGEVRGVKVEMLINSGYDVEDATDGADAWEAIQDRRFNLVITDNKMPKMTGVELIEKLRSSRMTIPVIMATSVMPDVEFVRRPWLKPDIGLTIPFSDDELLVSIERLLNQDDDDDDLPESLLPQYL
jgi:CheY-like chemotaxis protein